MSSSSWARTSSEMFSTPDRSGTVVVAAAVVVVVVSSATVVVVWSETVEVVLEPGSVVVAPVPLSQATTASKRARMKGRRRDIVSQIIGGYGLDLTPSAAGGHLHPQAFSAVETTSRNFSHCSSSVRALPSIVLANPHWGLRHI